jgi:hypothetical protein
MRDEMLAAARQSGISADTAVIVGLSNGYVMYVATAEEYGTKSYEGASTLYGPGEAAMFGRALAGLTQALSTGDVLPPANARTLLLNPGRRKAILRPERTGGAVPGKVERIWCSGDTLYADFQFGAVQDWPARRGSAVEEPLAEVVVDDAVVARDNEVSLELHLRSLRKHPARWQLRWSGARQGFEYRIRLRGGFGSGPVRCNPPDRTGGAPRNRNSSERTGESPDGDWELFEQRRRAQDLGLRTW